MGYDLHITRADLWTDYAMYPIALAEWIAVADTEPGLTREGVHDGVPSYTYTNDDGRNWALDWRNGGIIIWKGCAAAAPLAAVAQRLGARLVGDDYEEYHTDGTSTEWTEPRPILFERPLYANECAAAWEAIFDRQDDDFHSWRRGPDDARYAFFSFRAFAAREVKAADVPDADGLLYQYGSLAGGSEPVFVLSLVRQVATDTDSGLAQVECRLTFPMRDELAGLGSFAEWWFPHDATSRDAWFDAIAARPEWQLLNTLTPSELTFGGGTAC